MRFIDEATITVRSGKGGDGCASFRREKFIPNGGPDGGDGGDGGDVILRAEDRLLTLHDFRHKRIHQAENGKPGMGKDRYGRAGQDLMVEVPPGTLVHEIGDAGKETLIADLTEKGQEVVVCRGGRGGRGNIHFKSSTRRAPRFAEQGKPGEEKKLRLELKLLADAGLLGLPNAGKSTLISAISAARPKVAAYPFTTLEPNLGVLRDDYGNRFVVADIPGLIEGAGEGAGLGHTFLKHVDRSRFLVHLLSVEDMGEEDPFAGYALLQEELTAFDPGLAAKEQIKAVNKIDLLDDEGIDRLQDKAREAGLDLHFISALEGDGVEELVEAMWKMFRRHEGENQEEETGDA